jgi:peptide/nickel transport system permease protein
MVPSLIGVTLVVFLMLRLIPGTVVEQMLGLEALATKETVESLRRFFGLDQPIHVQYAEWAGRVLSGDLGRSWRTAQPVTQLIWSRLPVTLELTLLSILVSIALGVATGIVSALRQGTLLDNLTRLGSLFGLSIPVFWQGTMLILLLSFYFGWAPPVDWANPFQEPGTNLKMMALPALCLGTASAATVMRMSRATLLDVLRQDYIRTAHAKGASQRGVVAGHALKNAMIPVITVVGLQVGTLLGGVVVVEEVFTLPGVGRLILQAIYARDYPVVQGTVLFIAVLFMVTNLIVDVCYAALDPRIRYG